MSKRRVISNHAIWRIVTRLISSYIFYYQTVNIVLTRTLIRRIRFIQFLHRTQTTALP